MFVNLNIGEVDCKISWPNGHTLSSNDMQMTSCDDVVSESVGGDKMDNHVLAIL